MKTPKTAFWFILITTELIKAELTERRRTHSFNHEHPIICALTLTLNVRFIVDIVEHCLHTIEQNNVLIQNFRNIVSLSNIALFATIREVSKKNVSFSIREKVVKLIKFYRNKANWPTVGSVVNSVLSVGVSTMCPPWWEPQLAWR